MWQFIFRMTPWWCPWSLYLAIARRSYGADQRAFLAGQGK